MIYKPNIPNLEAKKIKEQLEHEKPVIIFGTGNFGKIVCKYINEIGIKIEGFGDNNQKNWGTRFCGYKIFSNDEIKSQLKDRTIVVASLSFPYIKRQLIKMGIQNILDCDFVFSVKYLDLKLCDTSWDVKRCKEQIDSYLFSIDSVKKRTHRELNVKHLDLVLTEKCSLKCKDCSNLMQYYENPIDEDYDQMINAFKQFMSAVDHVNEVRLIGGEPLMFKRIADVLNEIYKFSNYQKIYVYTNGTIVPKGEKLEAFKNDKVLFRISDYGKISRNADKLENTLIENNINYIREKIKTWQDCAIISEFDRSEELTKHIFGNCCVNQFLTLLHGKLYICPYQAHAENLRAIPISKNDHIDLNVKQDNLKEKIEKLYFDKEFINACKNCNGRDPNVENVEAALQTSEPLFYNKVF